MSKKVTIPDIQKKKQDGIRIKMMTAYDYPTAVLVDESEVDIVLVGDSVAMAVLGHPNTVSITMDEMLHHCKPVARGTQRAFLTADMPFLSYHTDERDAVLNAGRFIKEAGMEAVKLEGGLRIIDKIKAILSAGIPVMGHLGLTPQSFTQLGGYRVQGKTADTAQRMLDDAHALEDAGCFSMVLELVPTNVAEMISQNLTIPTIGIGAGPGCDGQVLVFHDILGLFDKFSPKFVKRYADLKTPIKKALAEFCSEVAEGKFPGKEHSFHSDDPELLRFLKKNKNAPKN